MNNNQNVQGDWKIFVMITQKRNRSTKRWTRFKLLWMRTDYILYPNMEYELLKMAWLKRYSNKTKCRLETHFYAVCLISHRNWKTKAKAASTASAEKSISFEKIKSNWLKYCVNIYIQMGYLKLYPSTNDVQWKSVMFT